MSLYRKRWRLSQKELAQLLGLKVHSSVALLEKGIRDPRKVELIALAVIFGASPQTLFPQYYQHIEDEVMRRGAALSVKLEGRSSTAADLKRKLLDAMMARADFVQSA